MKFSRFFCTAAILGLSLGFSAAVAHADGSDGRLGTKPIPPTDPPPACTSVQFTADSNGAITDGTAVCAVSANTSEITIIVPDSELGTPGVNGPNLQVYSSLTQDIPSSLVQAFPFLSGYEWMSSCNSSSQSFTTAAGVLSQECTLTAPKLPTNPIELAIINTLTLQGIIDSDPLLPNGNPNPNLPGCTNSIFFVAAGCDLDFTTDAIGNQLGDQQGQFLSPDAQVDSTNGNSAPTPFPEPGSLALLGMGLAGLPFLRRKLAR